MGFVILRCTRKLLEVIKPGALADEPGSDEDWYANLLRIGGRTCLLLAHAGTLFTIFEPGVRAAALRDTGRLVTGLIGREVAREGLVPGTFGGLDPASVVLGKTASRTVLGCMNDMAFLCEHAADLTGGLANADIGDINQRLRRNILSARGYQQPIELTMRRAEIEEAANRFETLASTLDPGSARAEHLPGPGPGAETRRIRPEV
jgi:hypothetical protein